MPASLLPSDSPELRKQRGAFFTPPAIADFLAAWATAGRADARVLDPTCGEAVFLLAAARRLAANGAAPASTRNLLHGVDLHEASRDHSRALLHAEGYDAQLVSGDFFAQPTPAQLGGRLPWMDAVVGNPPFVRYQGHRGEARKLSAAAALAQGVRLSGLASSWAALLVHACSFLQPDGRVAMVLPAELMTVGYAEPLRRWLRTRFAAVHLVLFEQLQLSSCARASGRRWSRKSTRPCSRARRGSLSKTCSRFVRKRRTCGAGARGRTTSQCQSHPSPMSSPCSTPC
jgi:methylase of polypeptide subunit release factors